MAGPFPYQLGAITRSTNTTVEFGIIAPVCDVTISFRGNLEVVPGILDSGSSRTVLPHRLARELNLMPTYDTALVTYSDGTEEQRTYYVANLSFLGFDFRRHRVLTRDKREHILIGRDIMNRHKITLDGPPHQFYIE
jgi:hypothetical protein